MANLQAQQLADLITTTLNELGEMKFTDLMSDYQNTIVLKRTMKKNKMTFDAGPAVQFNVITDHNNSARFVGLGEEDRSSINNVMTTGVVPWRHVTWNWSVERREIAMNRTPRKIVDLAKTRRLAAFGSAIILMEQSAWRVPAVTDTLSPFGIPYWIVKSATDATTDTVRNGFNGTLPSGYTDVGGISPTTYPRWANYADIYTNISKDDLIRKWRRAAFYTDFAPLVDGMPVYNTGDDYGYYSNYPVVGRLEEILEAQNDNLGNDVASKDGQVVFRRVPVSAVIELDKDTTGPVYGINWGEFKTMGLRGEWMNETQIPIVSGQHTMSTTHTDCTFNWHCRNRRRNFVLATAATLPS